MCTRNALRHPLETRLALLVVYCVCARTVHVCVMLFLSNLQAELGLRGDLQVPPGGLFGRKWTIPLWERDKRFHWRRTTTTMASFPCVSSPKAANLLHLRRAPYILFLTPSSSIGGDRIMVMRIYSSYTCCDWNQATRSMCQGLCLCACFLAFSSFLSLTLPALTLLCDATQS